MVRINVDGARNQEIRSSVAKFEDFRDYVSQNLARNDGKVLVVF
jgi:hypothetical protein